MFTKYWCIKRNFFDLSMSYSWINVYESKNTSKIVFYNWYYLFWVNKENNFIIVFDNDYLLIIKKITQNGLNLIQINWHIFLGLNNFIEHNKS